MRTAKRVEVGLCYRLLILVRISTATRCSAASRSLSPAPNGSAWSAPTASASPPCCAAWSAWTGPGSGTSGSAPATRIGWYAQQVPDPARTVGEHLDAAPGPLAALARELAGHDLTDPAALAGYADVQERFAQQGGWAYQARVESVLSRLGVDQLPRAAPLGRLSGGEQARVMLAQVLLSEPTVLVLDEPTNHLDAEGTRWLADYLADFPGSVLVVTHDRAFLDAVATGIFELDGIHDELQVYDGNYTAYRAEKQRRWERLLLDYEAQEKARRRLAADIENTKNHALSVEDTIRSGAAAPHLRRLAKKVAKKAKVRERRLARQMQATSWLGAADHQATAEPRLRPGGTRRGAGHQGR